MQKVSSLASFDDANNDDYIIQNVNYYELNIKEDY